jgi:hypothetical protein
MSLSRRAVGIVAALIGHTPVTVVRRGPGFIAECGCGYTSTKRRTVPLAADAAVHHLETAIKAFQASGKPWPHPKPVQPAPPLFDTPEERTFESRRVDVA